MINHIVVGVAGRSSARGDVTASDLSYVGRETRTLADP